MPVRGHHAENLPFGVQNGHPCDVGADEIARPDDDRAQEILQAQGARKVVGRIDQNVQAALGKRIVLHRLPDPADLEMELLEARGVVAGLRRLSQGLDKTVDFGIAHAERNFLQKLGGRRQNALRHQFSSREASSTLTKASFSNHA